MLIVIIALSGSPDTASDFLGVESAHVVPIRDEYC
jgi:hypothetical protein